MISNKAILVISNSVILSNERGELEQSKLYLTDRKTPEKTMKQLNLPQSRMLGAAAVTTRVAVAVIFLASVALCSNNNSEELCSRTCAAENCNSVGIRYGKYCGVGWTGCPGEKPCDDVDACCKIHDDCVGNTGINDVKCHEKFKKCIKKVQKSGKVGFSKQCPYETVVPTMVQGMDLAIMFSQFSNSKLEL